MLQTSNLNFWHALGFVVTMKHYQSLQEALEDLKQRGYETDFATGTDGLYCGDLENVRLDPAEFHIDEVYSIEDNSSPDQNCILYAITSISGAKGTIVDTQGAAVKNPNSRSL